MHKNDLDKELNGLAMEQDQDMDALIDKVIKQKMRKIALKTVLAALLIVALIFLGISPIMNIACTNPVTANEAEDGEASQLIQVLRAYYDVTSPYLELVGVDVEKEGFGCYTLYFDMTDAREKNIVGDTDFTMEMKRGTLSSVSDPYGYAIAVLGTFFDPNEAEAMSKAEKQELLAEIRALPDTSTFYVTVSLDEAKAISELQQLETDEFCVEWVQVYEPGCEFQAGLDLHNTVSFGDGWRDEMTAEELKEVYLENLQLLYDHTDLWQGLRLYSGSTIYESRKQTLGQVIEAAEKNAAFETKNYCISGTKEVILEYLEDNDFLWISVDHVKYSEFE